MLKKILLTSAGLVMTSAVAMANPDNDLSNPSTTGTGAMEQPSSEIRDAGSSDRNETNDRAGDTGSEPGLGTMGTGATGTTGGMGATTGTDTIEGRDDETEQ